MHYCMYCMYAHTLCIEIMHKAWQYASTVKVGHFGVDNNVYMATSEITPNQFYLKQVTIP